MSARTVRGDWSESLTDAYWSAVNAPTNPEAADKTLALLDAYAHELAEKQRDYAEEEWPGNDARMILRRRVARHVADLIDPEKKETDG